MNKNSLNFFIVFIIIIIFSFGMLMLVANKNNETSHDEYNVYLFYRETCGYCHNLITFLESMSDEFQEKYNLVKYDVSSDAEYSNLMYEVGSHFGDEVSGVPYLVIGNKTFKGYSSAYDDQIIDAINELQDNYYDVLKEIY